MKFLIADDNADERALTIEALRDEFEHAEFVEISGPEAFGTGMADLEFDLAITEHALGGGDGLLLLKTLKARRPCIPVIMLTAHGSEAVAVAGMKGGLSDYLPKSQRHRLVEAVRGCLQKAGTGNLCKPVENNQMCEKWDLAISRLTSDYAYSVRVGPDGGLTCEWVTEPFSRVTGYPLRAVRERSDWLAPVLAEDRPVFERWLDTLRAGQQDTCEYRILTHNGEVRWLRDHAMPVRDWSRGKVVRIYGAAQDVSDRRKAESEQRLMWSAIESSNNGIVITGLADSDYGIIYANSAFQHMTGYSMEELRGRNCRFLQGDDRSQMELDALRHALRSQRDGYSMLRNYRKDGSLFWNEIYISPVCDEHGRLTHYVGIQNDITERKKSEATLARYTQEVQDLYDNAPCGYHSLSPDGSFLRINATELRWLGYARDEVVGKMKFTDILTPRSREVFDQCFPGFRQAGHVEDEEFELVRKDGSVFPVVLSASALLDEHGKFLMSRAALYDITDRKRVEEAQKQLSSHLQLAREEERARISREIHDQFGSLLAALKLSVRWLSKRLEHEPVLHEKTIEIAHLIKEAMQSAREISTALRPSILDNLGLLPAIDWQVKQFTKHTGIPCELAMPSDEYLEMESERATAVFRILQEALTNISLHAHASRASVSVQVGEHELSMTISDNGRGIAGKSATGTHGMFGMIERAQHFGGKLHVSSQPGQGVTVVLQMPLENSPSRDGQ
ncbi:MAG: PAS domain S-box protein [Thiobacillus sp.]|nr:PAS domain S-box protein [Thiobacillus sp.]